MIAEGGFGLVCAIGRLCRWVVLLASIAVLTGCNTSAVSQLVPEHAVINKDSAGNVHLGALKYEVDSVVPIERVGKCAAIHLSYDEFTVTRDRQYLGSYTGNVYQYEALTNVSAGERVLHVDEKTFITKGRVKYHYTEGVASIIPQEVVSEYRLVVEQGAGKTHFSFQDLKTIFVDGAGYNNNFQSIAAWDSPYLSTHLQHLEAMAEQLLSCVKSAG